MTQERIVVLVDSETKKNIEELAKKEGRTMSKYFVNCHNEHLEKIKIEAACRIPTPFILNS